MGIALVGSVFTNILMSNLPAGLQHDGSNSTNIPALNQIPNPSLHEKASIAYMTAFRSIFLVVFPVSILAGIVYSFVRVDIGAKELRHQSQENQDILMD